MTVTRRDRKLIWQLTAALAGAVVVIATLVLAITAIVRQGTIGACVNNSLGGTRSVKSQRYDAAVADAFDLLGEALTGAVNGQDPAVRKRFLADVATVHSVAAYRNTHRLGKC